MDFKQRPTSRPPFASTACPRCGSSSTPPFVTGGVCLRCAGVRVLELESAPSFSIVDDSAEPATPESGQVKDLTHADLPERIGSCEIIEELGRGGMGRVYAARQVGLGRIVALKAIRAGQGAADLELRFLREAQTIARLRHPSIVAVHESGRAHGYVYFTMDYVDGGDLARRMRERPFAPREAATLLRKVANALAYTHGEGVLHRDLKPSNVLLDGEEPRVADFGLAAQLEPGGDLTASGVLGTPHYLAPEALRGGTAALGVASDLYALGVILFQMLTGRTPFAGMSPAEWMNVAETLDPPAPRLLAPAVPRDLETICLKCLERDPGRRYANAAALAEDLRRFLADEPILARPPNAVDRFRKYARRHRAAFIAACSVVVVLVAATAISLGLAVRAARAERLAAVEAQTSRELANFLQNDLLAQAAPGVQPDRDVKLRTVVDRAAQRIAGRFTAQPLVEAELRHTLGRTYRELGDYAAARAHYERELALRRTVLGAGHPTTWRALRFLAETHYYLGDYARAEPLAAGAMAAQVRGLGPEHADTLATKTVLASVLHELGRSDRAEALLHETLAAQRRLLGSSHLSTVETIGSLSGLYLDRGRFDAAETLLRSALDDCRRAHGPDHFYVLLVTNNLAGAVWCQGRFAEAEALHRRNWEDSRRVLGLEHPDTLRSLNNVGRCHMALGQFAEAAAVHAQLLEIRRRLFGADSHETLRSQTALASARRALRQFDEAEGLFRESLAGAERTLGIENPDTLNTLDGLAETLLARGRAGEAERLFREALARREHVAASEWATAATRSRLGQTLVQLGRMTEAEPLLIAGFDGLCAAAAAIPASERRQITEAGERVVHLYAALGRGADAEEWRSRLAGLR